MKETGIIMSGNQPSLILDGRKTMTRRTWGLEEINKDPDSWVLLTGTTVTAQKGIFEFWSDKGYQTIRVKCPYGGVGDWLYCKETSYKLEGTTTWLYKADNTPMLNTLAFPTPIDKTVTKSSRFMPKWAARIWREITEVRAEKLWTITPGDCVREGVQVQFTGDLKPRFKELWDFLYAKRGHGWDKNEWVFVISFKEGRRCQSTG